MNWSLAGNGALDDGTRRYNLTDASVHFKGDQCRITLITDRQQRLEMTGSVSRATPRCIINSSNRGRASANAYIHMDGTRVMGLDVQGNINGRNFQSNFRIR